MDSKCSRTVFVYLIRVSYSLRPSPPKIAKCTILNDHVVALDRSWGTTFSSNVQYAFTDNGRMVTNYYLQMLDLPPWSSDLNPIEQHLWDLSWAYAEGAKCPPSFPPCIEEIKWTSHVCQKLAKKKVHFFISLKCREGEMSTSSRRLFDDLWLVDYTSYHTRTGMWHVITNHRNA